MMLKNTWYTYKGRVLILLLSIHSGSIWSMELVQKETPFSKEQIAQIELVVLRERLYHTTEVFSYKTLCKLLCISKGMTKAILDPCQVERRRDLVNALLMQRYTTLPAGIVYNDLGACGWVQPICGRCLLETPCEHEESVSKIPDMLCRAQLGKNKHLRIYKAYIRSEQTNKFVKLYSEIQAFPECKIVTKVLRPDHKYRCSTSSSTDTRMPYFDQHNHLSVITGEQGCDLEDQKEIGICRLSGYKKYTQHECKIAIGDHIYALEALKRLPLFLQSVLQTPTMQRTIFKYTDGKIIITFPGALTTADGNALEPDLYTLLGNMMSYLQDRETRRSHQKQLKHYYEWKKIPWTNEIFLKAALCAKLGGNENLAIDYLEGYNESEAEYIGDDPTKKIDTRYQISFAPMGNVSCYDSDGTLANHYCKPPVSHYREIVGKLETVQGIQNIVHTLHKNKPHILQSHKNYLGRVDECVQIMQYENLPIVLHWKLSDSCSIFRWRQHHGYTMPNYVGAIIRVEFHDKKSHFSLIEEITEQNGEKTLVRYTFKPGKDVGTRSEIGTIKEPEKEEIPTAAITPQESEIKLLDEVNTIPESPSTGSQLLQLTEVLAIPLGNNQSTTLIAPATHSTTVPENRTVVRKTLFPSLFSFYPALSTYMFGFKQRIFTSITNSLPTWLTRLFTPH